MTPPRALLLAGRRGVELRHRRVLRRLQAAYPGFATLSELIEANWYDRDEPEFPERVIRITIHQLRKAGWVIGCFQRIGYRLAPASYDRLTLPVTTQERTR